MQITNSNKFMRFIGIIVVAGLIAWAGSSWLNKDKSPSTTTTSTATTPGDDSTKKSTTASEKSKVNTTKATEHRTFNYIPEEPVNGVKKGVIEVGAAGFNSFVVLIDAQKRWKVIAKDFNKSFVYEKLATTEDIRTGLRNYIMKMGEEHGVAGKNIHFVVSSGALKEPKTSVIISELKKQGYVVNTVTAEQEGKLALKCVQPTSYKNSSFVTDIGSGNTKLSLYDGNTLKALEAPGAKYYEKSSTDETVYADVKNKASQIPTANREVCFIIGGVPFELAKEIREGDERYTVLNSPDWYTSEKQKIKCGLNIYKAISDATQCDTFVFDWDANFTIGFLLGLP